MYNIADPLANAKSVVSAFIDPLAKKTSLPPSLTTSDTARSLNNYSIGKYSYPEDVGNSPDLQHTIAFFINVRSNSEYTNKQKLLFEVSDVPVVTKGGVIGGAIVGATAVTAVSAGSAAYSIGKSALSNSSMARKLLNKNVATKKNIKEQATNRAGAIAGVVDTAAKAAGAAALVGATAASFSTSKMYRLKDAITLAVQEAPKTSYKMNYENFDAGTLMGGTSFGALPEMLQVAALKTAQIPGAIGAPDFGKGIQKFAGESINPFKTVLFKDVPLRTFTFNYKFMPKTKNEAENVKNIIQTFKIHMHPEFSSSKVFLIHPSEFNIVYYFKGKENGAWNKISTCVLTDMDLDSGAEQLNTFSDGMSVEINMKLTFMETEIITREKIIQGF